MISRKSSFAIGALTAVVIAGTGTAMAATSGNFILGKKNSATATTTLSDSKGTPLSLVAKKGSAPLKVNTNTKVTHLNADQVDGKSSGDFALKAGSTGYVDYESQWVDMDGDGTNEALVAVAPCPAGSELTGGGFYNLTTHPTFGSGPAGDNSWGGITLADPANSTADLTVWALCYNPTGKVKGATSTLASTTDTTQPTNRTLPKAQIEQFARAVTNR